MSNDDAFTATGRWRLVTRAGATDYLPGRLHPAVVVAIERCNRTWHTMDVDTIPLLRELYTDLRPADVQLVLGVNEDGAELMGAIAGDHADPDAQPRRVALH